MSVCVCCVSVGASKTHSMANFTLETPKKVKFCSDQVCQNWPQSAKFQPKMLLCVPKLVSNVSIFSKRCHLFPKRVVQKMRDCESAKVRNCGFPNSSSCKLRKATVSSKGAVCPNPVVAVTEGN